MKLVAVDNYDKQPFKWIATFENYSQRFPIKRILFGTGEPTYVDTGDVIQRRTYRNQNPSDEFCNVDSQNKLKYYLLYGDSTNIQENLKSFKGWFRI